MVDKVNICGIQYKVIEVEETFTAEMAHYAEIDYKKAEIRVNRDLQEDVKKESLCHEIVHGIFASLGYYEQNNNEQFVQALGNAISQIFDIKEPAASKGKCLSTLGGENALWQFTLEPTEKEKNSSS